MNLCRFFSGFRGFRNSVLAYHLARFVLARQLTSPDVFCALVQALCAPPRGESALGGLRPVLGGEARAHGRCSRANVGRNERKACSDPGFHNDIHTGSGWKALFFGGGGRLLGLFDLVLPGSRSLSGLQSATDGGLPPAAADPLSGAATDSQRRSGPTWIGAKPVGF